MFEIIFITLIKVFIPFLAMLFAFIFLYQSLWDKCRFTRTEMAKEYLHLNPWFEWPIHNFRDERFVGSDYDLWQKGLLDIKNKEICDILEEDFHESQNKIKQHYQKAFENHRFNKNASFPKTKRKYLLCLDCKHTQKYEEDTYFVWDNSGKIKCCDWIQNENCFIPAEQKKGKAIPLTKVAFISSFYIDKMDKYVILTEQEFNKFVFSIKKTLDWNSDVETKLRPEAIQYLDHKFLPWLENASD